MGVSPGSKLLMGEPDPSKPLLFSEVSGKDGGPRPQWFNLVCSNIRKSSRKMMVMMVLRWYEDGDIMFKD